MAYKAYTQTVVHEIKEIPDRLKGFNNFPPFNRILDPNNIATLDCIRSMSIDLLQEIISELEAKSANRIAIDYDSETGYYTFTGLNCQPDYSDAEIKAKQINDLEYAIKVAKRDVREYEEYMSAYLNRIKNLESELEQLKKA